MVKRSRRHGRVLVSVDESRMICSPGHASSPSTGTSPALHPNASATACSTPPANWSTAVDKPTCGPGCLARGHRARHRVQASRVPPTPWRPCAHDFDGVAALSNPPDIRRGAAGTQLDSGERNAMTDGVGRGCVVAALGDCARPAKLICGPQARSRAACRSSTRDRADRRSVRACTPGWLRVWWQ